MRRREAEAQEAVTGGMQFYERAAEHRAQGRQISSRQVPARLIGSDGRLQIGLPLAAPADPGTNRSADGFPTAAPNAASGNGMVVLMNPLPPFGDGGPAIMPRRQLVAVLLMDLASLVLLVSDLSWRTVHVRRLTALGLAGFSADGLGLVACLFPGPRLLGLLFVVALLQFFTGMVLLQTPWQLVHCFVQPFVAQAALGLRRALVPAWFAVGRGRPSTS